MYLNTGNFVGLKYYTQKDYRKLWKIYASKVTKKILTIIIYIVECADLDINILIINDKNMTLRS